MRGEDLSRAEAAELLDACLILRLPTRSIAAPLIALQVKGETFEELAGLTEAMRERAVRITSRQARFVDTAARVRVASRLSMFRRRQRS